MVELVMIFVELRFFRGNLTHVYKIFLPIEYVEESNFFKLGHDRKRSYNRKIENESFGLNLRRYFSFNRVIKILSGLPLDVTSGTSLTTFFLKKNVEKVCE